MGTDGACIEPAAKGGVQESQEIGRSGFEGVMRSKHPEEICRHQALGTNQIYHQRSLLDVTNACACRG
jgi:hypothetical protein